MRIALVSPYSWTYPGGVTRHIEALAEQLLAAGHHVRVLAPFDPPDARSERLHRGARPQDRALPDYVIPLGRTVGIPANGAVSNLALHAAGLQRLRRELEAGDFDVVNVHEPVAPSRQLGRARVRRRGARRHLPHLRHERRHPRRRPRDGRRAPRMRHLHGRIAVSEAAAWTARRFFGGRYDIVPNGVEVPRGRSAATPGAAGRAADRVRRPGRRAQGPAGAAARVRGPARARRRRARDRRRRAREVEPLLLDDSRRHAFWPRRRRREDPRPARGRRALRAVARRRELRHGPHGGVRAGHAGRRERHRRLPRRRRATAATASSSRAATRSRSPRRCARWRSRPSGSPRWAPPPPSTRAATPGRRSPPRSSASTSRRSPPRPRARRRPRRPPRRVARRLALARRRPAAPCPPRRHGDARARARGRRRRARLRSAARRGALARRGHRRPRADRASRCSGSASTGSPRACCARARRGCSPRSAVMCASMVLRAIAWHAILRAGAAGSAGHARGRLPGHRDRRADVRDAAGTPRRARARADRRAPRRAPARDDAGRDRHDRLADDAQRARARRARRHRVLERPRLRRPSRRARRGGRDPARDADRRARRPRDPARRHSERFARAARGRAPDARRDAAGARRPARLPRPARRRRRRRSRSSPRGRCSGSPATCCSSRWASTPRPASARPPRCCSRST